MSALNLLNQPDTFGNYFHATLTPPHRIHYQKNLVSNILYGVGEDNNKTDYRRKKLHPSSQHRPHPSKKRLNNRIDNIISDR